MRVCQGMVLELRQEEGGMNMGVSMVDMGVVCLGTACHPEGGHGVGPSILTQGPQCWRVGAKIRTTYTNSQGPLVATGPSHGGME